MDKTQNAGVSTDRLDSLVRQECSEDELPCNGCYYRTDGGGPCAAPSVLPCWDVEDYVQYRFIDGTR
jgi:hypothetical protein